VDILTLLSSLFPAGVALVLNQQAISVTQTFLKFLVDPQVLYYGVKLDELRRGEDAARHAKKRRRSEVVRGCSSDASSWWLQGSCLSVTLHSDESQVTQDTVGSQVSRRAADVQSDDSQ
jgi:hypothetical protein